MLQPHWGAWGRSVMSLGAVRQTEFERQMNPRLAGLTDLVLFPKQKLPIN